MMQDRIGFLLDGVRPNDGDWFSDIVSDPKEPAFSNCRRESGGFKMPGASITGEAYTFPRARQRGMG